MLLRRGGRTICWTANSLDDAGIEVITAEDDANADLLAAAPDLLSALEWIAKISGVTAEAAIARAAITKAKGEYK